MMLKNRHPILFPAIICVVLSFLFTSCSPLLTMPDSSSKAGRQDQTVQKIAPKVSKPSYYNIEHKADAAIKAGNYHSGLNIYNNLLEKYSGADKKRLLGKIDALLSIMRTTDLEHIMQSDKNMIPESILLYRMGTGYAQKNDNKKAKDSLSKFISKYPNDKHVGEAEKLLKEIELKSFAKNSIGCMLPLSGKYQVFGKQALRGVKMALEDAKTLYNTNDIIFVIKDTQSNDYKAVECVQELAQSDIAAIAGPMVTSEAAAKEAQKNQIPMICMTQKSDITSTGNYIFANFITPEMQIKGLVSYAKEVLNVQKFVVLSPNDKYGQTFTSLFKQAVDQAGGDIVFTEVYREKTSNFSDIIKKLAANLPQQLDNNMNPSDALFQPEDSNPIYKTAIFIPDSPLKVAKILPQLTSNNIQNFYLLGTNIWHNKALLKLSSTHVQNAVITDGFFAKSRKPEADNFTEAFKAMYGEEPGFIEAVAYDTALMLIKTAMDKSVNSRASLQKALAGNIIYNGVTGETMFDKNGNIQKELFFLTIKNNQFVEIESY
ncbi:MAG: penicillin-binding protein activator [Desulfamplus sp.]